MSDTDIPLQILNNFTSTTHGPTIPSNLSLPTHTLPPNFTVLILGASEGIGEHIARAYAAALPPSGTLIIASRRLPALTTVASSLHAINPQITITHHACDIADPASVASLATTLQTAPGRLDCIIPVAAYAPPITLKLHLDQPPDVQRAFAVSTLGTYYAAHYFVPLLMESEGGARQFLAVGSLAGSIRRGHIANMGYCVSKMAQTRIVEYLHEQYSSPGLGESEGRGEAGLFAICVHPGAVRTSMAKGNTPASFEPYLVDDVGLCGAAMVYLSKKAWAGEVGWLGGRFVSANWEMDELMEKKGEIVEKDLLKFAIQV